MKKLLKLGILLILVIFLFNISTGFKSQLFASTTRNFDDLSVDFHISKGLPLFVVSNMKPGDIAKRSVDIKNGIRNNHTVFTKGVRKGGVGLDPKLETSLLIVITNGKTPVYGLGSSTGPKTLLDFFNDSSISNGISLGSLAKSKHKTFIYTVIFPTSAGNIYQAKSVIFDLTFGTKNFMPNIHPKEENECKKDGWKKFDNPLFKNQGACVSYVQSNINAGKRN